MLKRTRFAFRNYGGCIGKTLVALVEAAPHDFWIRYASNNGSGEFTNFMAYPIDDGRWQIRQGHFRSDRKNDKIVDDLILYIDEYCTLGGSLETAESRAPFGTLILTARS